MISGRMNVSEIFGPAHKGHYRKIGPRFSRVRTAIRNLSVPATALTGDHRAYGHAFLSLIDGLGEISTYPTLVDDARAAAERMPASPSTFTFIANYLRMACRAGLAEDFAIKNVLENTPAILLSTTYIPYPSVEGRNLLHGMRFTHPDDAGGVISSILPQAAPQDIAHAVSVGFNPLRILYPPNNITQAPREEGALHRYIWLSKQALLSFARTLTRQYSGEPDPLWVFLMRDAHLLYLVAGQELPGEKLEIDVGKITLATEEERDSIFEARGYNVGDAKDTLPVRGYEHLIHELGFDSLADDSPTARPRSVVEQLVQRPPNGDLAKDLQQFRSAQEILSNLTIPEQIFQILATSGIADAAENNRPVVFVDTGFKGSLPLLLQAALNKTLTERGRQPNVHSWLDYAREPFNRLIGSHAHGPWSVSPLDGFVSLRRVLIPSSEGQNIAVFTTPFDAMRQTRIVRPYDVYEAGRI